jgi:hypothetical protein
MNKALWLIAMILALEVWGHANTFFLGRQMGIWETSVMMKGALRGVENGND